jgi:hypothetical protein
MIKQLFKFLTLSSESKEQKAKRISEAIDNDPVIKKLDKDITDLNKKASKYIKKDAKYMSLLKKYGIEIE